MDVQFSEDWLPVVQLAEYARTKKVHLFVSHAGRFRDPLIAKDRSRLRELTLDERTFRVTERIAEECTGPAIYFPVPMARALDMNVSWLEVVKKYHYDMIVVDEGQQWSWRGSPVAARTQNFFLEHLSWRPEVNRYAFEYKVNESWWDKSYLEVATTPLTALRLEVVTGGDQAEVRAHLQNGQSPLVILDSFRFDQKERLFVGTEGLGEVLVGDTERFKILRGVDDGLATVDFAGARRPLKWPAR